MVDRLIHRVGDGTSERPDKNNISSNAAIVQKTATSVTVHWRYAPDLTKLSFVEFRDAYNKAGNPSEFYAEYVDEYFTIHADGTVIREVKKGCYRLDEWNDHENQFTQKLKLTSRGIVQKSIATPKMQKLTKVAFQGEVVKKSPLVSVILNFTFDEALSYNQQQTTEVISKTACPIEGVAAYWRKGVSGTCLSFDSYSNAVVLPSSKCPSITDEFTIEAWVAPQEYPFKLAACLIFNDTKKIAFRQGYGLYIRGSG